MKLRLSEIAEYCKGKIIRGDPDIPVSGFFTDSREAKPGLMFVPVRGERTDGHKYIASAFSLGAAAAFSENPDTGGPAVVLVEDCRLALQMTAARYRERFDIPVIGVTGSVGKTTQKELIAAALSPKFNVHKTSGNRNSQVGVPMTVFGLNPDHTAAVIEMGVSMPHEMERIAKVVKPNIAVITGIGSAHLEFMKKKETTLSEKAHIADYLKRGEPLFLNADDPLLMRYAGECGKTAVTFGFDGRAAFRACAQREAGGGTFFTAIGQGERCELFVPAVGEHNVRNALCAFAVARYLSVSPGEIANAIASYRVPAGRQRITELSGVMIIDDSYNASPDSVMAALSVLKERNVKGKRVAVLADMLELGEEREKNHFDMGKYAKDLGIDALVAVGELSRETAKGFGDGGVWFATNEEAEAYLFDFLKSQDAVLVKGSRGMHTEEIVTALTDRLGGERENDA